ncbi:MAG: hypothetical protein FWE03_05615 [Firmicutes bacterium]|nr:hypothetical protein [Bacillota bacterium]
MQNKQQLTIAIICIFLAFLAIASMFIPDNEVGDVLEIIHWIIIALSVAAMSLIIFIGFVKRTKNKQKYKKEQTKLKKQKNQDDPYCKF